MSNKAEKVYDKLAALHGMKPSDVENNEYAYVDPAKIKHQQAESGKMVENNQMVVDGRTVDKHTKMPDAGEGQGGQYAEKHAPKLEADKAMKQAALDKLAEKWING